MVEFDKNRVYRYQGVRVGENGAKMSKNRNGFEAKIRQIMARGHPCPRAITFLQVNYRALGCRLLHHRPRTVAFSQVNYRVLGCRLLHHRPRTVAFLQVNYRVLGCRLLHHRPRTVASMPTSVHFFAGGGARATPCFARQYRSSVLSQYYRGA